MPQDYGNQQGKNRSTPFRLRQDLGYVPTRAPAEGDGGGGITFTGGPSGPVFTLTPIALGDVLANLSGANPDVPIATPFTFLNLTDTPGSYTGAALKYVRVNTAQTALEFATVVVPTSQWIPLVNGAEPPSLVSDGNGNLILVSTAI